MKISRKNIVDDIIAILKDKLNNKLEINTQTVFTDLNIDSIQYVEIIDEINKIYELDLDLGVIFDLNTVGKLSEEVFTRLNISEEKMNTDFIFRLLFEFNPLFSPENQECALLDFNLSSISYVELCDYLNRKIQIEISIEDIFECNNLFDLVSLIKAKFNSSCVNEHNSNLKSNIAIIGMSVKVGECENIESFWNYLIEGKTSIKEIERYGCDKDFYSNLNSEFNKSVSRWASLMPQIFNFDASFFGITPKEAERMDPQQRVLLEEVYHALEDAGYSSKRLDKNKVGIYVGARKSDYINADIYNKHGIHSQMFLGSDMGVLTGRISYLLNLKGPNVCIDNACSSGLTALNYACQDLLLGNIDIAIVGSIFLMPSKNFIIETSKTGMLSPTGLLDSFGQNADGTVLGEGCGVIILKRTSEAILEKDNIYAQILGTEVCQNGRTFGLTVPSSSSQISLFKSLVSKGNIDISSIRYIEMHSTGTKLGDPIEFESVKTVFASPDVDTTPCFIGSHKPNFGHTITSAGIIGLIKVALIMKHKIVPPTIKRSTINEKIDISHTNLIINDVPYNIQNKSFTAIVNSLGFNGSNAAALLGNYLQIKNCVDKVKDFFIPFSAKDERALKEILIKNLIWLESNKDKSLGDIAKTLQLGRNHYSKRISFVVSNIDELVEEITCFLKGVKYSESDKDVNLLSLKDKYESGDDIDWNTKDLKNYFYISLPTYQFEEKKFNIDNKLIKDGEQSVFCFEDKRDFLEIFNSHQISGYNILPAAFYISIILNQFGKNSIIRNLCFYKQCLEKDLKSLRVKFENKDDKSFFYFYRAANEQDIYASGELSKSEFISDDIEFNELFNPSFFKDDIYNKLSELNAVYSGCLQCLQEIQLKEDGILGKIEIDNFSFNTNELNYTSVIDATLQGILFFLGELKLPFLVNKIKFLASITSISYFKLIRKKEQFNVFIFDNKNNISIIIDGVYIKENLFDKYQLYVPFWKERYFEIENLNKDLHFNKALIVKEQLESSDDNIESFIKQIYKDNYLIISLDDIQHYESSNIDTFYYIPQSIENDDCSVDIINKIIKNYFLFLRWLIEHYETSNIKHILLTSCSIYLNNNSNVNLPCISIRGLAKTLSNEHINWSVLTLDINGNCNSDSIDKLSYIINNLKGYKDVCLSDNIFFELQLALPGECIDTKVSFIDNGLYVIVGGFGGIGFELCKFLSNNYNARLIVVGRKSIAECKNYISQLKYVEYYSVNLLDRAKINDFINDILSKYECINGVIHSALVLYDSSLKKMTEQQFYEVTAVKIDGCYSLFKLYEKTKDFVLFFSSCQSFLANPGQGNYCVASRFEDAFAIYLKNKIKATVKVINWGIWGDVGAVSSEFFINKMRKIGLYPISISNGLSIIKDCLKYNEHQFIAVNSNQSFIKRMGFDILEYKKLNLLHLVSKSILFNSEKILIRIKDKLSGLDKINCKYPYDILLKYIESTSPVIVSETFKENVSGEIYAYNELLSLSEKSILDIIEGKKRGVDVIFPNGSMQYVENIYTNNIIADWFLDQITVKLEEFISVHPNQNYRILEVGAGTGATTMAICNMLNKYSSRIHYTYTDISISFINYGKHKLGKYDYIDYKVFDLNKDPLVQGFELNSYDIVIATNVLHAVSDISYTISNINKILSKSGLLFINELTGTNTFLTLTFGLLDSWWIVTGDKYKRVDNSPLFNLSTWNTILADYNYDILNVITCPSIDSTYWSQNIIIAQKNKNLNINNDMSLDINKNNDVTSIVIKLIEDLTGSDVDLESLSINFLELGIDSIVAIEFISKLNELLNLDLIPSIVYNYTTPNLMISYIESLIHKKESHESIIINDNDDLTDIAIIGYSGHFSKYNNAEEFWSGIEKCENAVSLIPNEKWDTTLFYDKDVNNFNKTNSKWCGYVSGYESFDAAFYNISGNEAKFMDPQQRLMLEEGYKALEVSGYTGVLLKNKKCGVFVGCMEGDYYDRLKYMNVKMSPQAFWGNETSILASRISYLLDLRGPSITINTACSSSLVAVHLACQSLLSGESDLAIAGGVYVSVTPKYYILSSNAGMLSSDGKCKTFDASADGFVLGEGGGAIVLKKASAAIKDGDFIYGIIKGTAINQDGKSNGIIAPNGLSQRDLQLDTYHKFNINPETISYVESHGTGTILGDPIEFTALTESFGRYTEKKGFCHIGSVKANIGHLCAAAGIASIIKVLLCMKYKKIPGLVNFNKINSSIRLEDSPFTINTETIEWQPINNLRRAAINSFGFSGTNAHIIIDNYVMPKRSEKSKAYYIIVLSAKSVQRLILMVGLLRDYIKENKQNICLTDFEYTLINCRKYEHKRLLIIVKTVDELLFSFESLLGRGISDWENEIIGRIFNEDYLTLNDRELLSGQFDIIPYDKLTYHNTKNYILPLPNSPLIPQKFWFENNEANNFTETIDKQILDLDKSSLFLLEPVNVELDTIHNNFQLEEILIIHNSNANLNILSKEYRGNKFYILNLNDDENNVHIELNDIIERPSVLEDFFFRHLKINTIIIENCLLDNELFIHFYINFIQVLVKQKREFLLINIFQGQDIRNISLNMSLNGLLKSINFEHTNLKLKNIYVDEFSSMDGIIKDLDYTNENIEIIEGKKYTHLLKKTDFSSLDINSTMLIYNGTYLIAGGCGGVGRIVVKYLREKYNAKILIVGRKPKSQIDDIFIKDSHIYYIQDDISGSNFVSNLSKYIEDSNIIIDGVFNCTGIFETNYFSNIKYDDFIEVINPKINGTLNLYEFSIKYDIKLLVLFSSISSELGIPLGCSYSFANSFLDNFAYRTKRVKELGTHVISISWPYIMNGGMKIQAEGVAYMKNKLGLEAVSDMELCFYLEKILQKNRFSSNYIVVKGNVQKILDTVKNDGFLKPKSVSSVDFDKEVYAYLLNQCVSILGVSENDINYETLFEEMGMDSIYAIKLIDRLEDYIGVPISPDIIFSHPTVGSLSEFLSLKKSEHRLDKQQINIDEPNEKIADKRNDKIAIIGMSCCFGKASSVDELWKVLYENKHIFCPVDNWRWRDLNTKLKYNFYDNKQICWGGFIPNISLFDPEMFNIPIDKAPLIDPQHRLILTLSQSLFNNAGYTFQEINGSNIDVHIGGGSSSYINLHRHLIGDNDKKHLLVGMIPNMLSARLSDFYDFSGESVTYETACSSSLIALCKACDRLLYSSNPPEMAIVGGVKLLIDPYEIIGFQDSEILSPDGNIKVFDQYANGCILGEGAGLLLLKRYEDAVRDGDIIEAVISGYSINNDGKTMGITVPNKEAQKKVIVSSIESANISPKDIRYLEAHGTGTLLGDPIEIKAANEAFREFTSDKNFCGVGSIKSNIGHTLQASGIAGVIKSILIMKNNIIVKTINCTRPHPRFNFSDTAFYPVLENERINDKNYYISISSFGFGGTNSNVILKKFNSENEKMYYLKRHSIDLTTSKQQSFWLY